MTTFYVLHALAQLLRSFSLHRSLTWSRLALQQFRLFLFLHLSTLITCAMYVSFPWLAPSFYFSFRTFSFISTSSLTTTLTIASFLFSFTLYFFIPHILTSSLFHPFSFFINYCVSFLSSSFIHFIHLPLLSPSSLYNSLSHMPATAALVLLAYRSLTRSSFFFWLLAYFRQENDAFHPIGLYQTFQFYSLNAG